MKEVDSVSLKIEGQDYMDLGDKFVIFNVPLAAELVQSYSDGRAYKPKDEVQKIDVQNVPLTVNALSPTHPPVHLSNMTTDEKAQYIVGLMSDPSRPKSDADPRKRYADYILFKNDITQVVIDEYKRGAVIDTSIGFKYQTDDTSGTFDGVKYDYVQRNITLDHNTILMDAFGRQGTGRMPSPIGGIGADSAQNKNNEMGENQMGDKSNDELAKELATVTSQRDALDKQLKAIDQKAIKEGTDALVKQTDALTKELATVKKERDDITTKHKTASDELKVFQDAVKTQLEEMRNDLSEKQPDNKDLFTDATDDTIRTYHKKMLEAQGKDSRSVSADMMGTGKNGKKVDELARTKQWISDDSEDNNQE